MTAYLFDTSVLSAFAPDRSPVAPAVSGWFRERNDRIFASVITLAEIETGIRKLQLSGGWKRADILSAWLDATTEALGGRLLDLTPSIARRTGRLAADASATGNDPGFADLAIAATALEHGLTVLTRNVRHFAPVGLPVRDPLAL